VRSVETLTDDVSALANTTDTLTARVGEAESEIQSVSQAVVDEAGARAQQFGTLTADLNGTKALVQDTSSAVVGLGNEVHATRNIKVGVDVNGRYYSAGMGIGVENTPSGMQSMVLFLADLFAVMNQPGGTPKSVFAINNGQVFMNSAIINQADIINLIITGELKSANYVPGQSGIRINFVTSQVEINGVVSGQGRLNISQNSLAFYDTNGRRRILLGQP